MSGSKRFAGSKGKQKRVSNASTTSPTNASSIPTLSKSASMRSTGFVSPNGKSSMANEQEEDENENGSKPSNVWCKSHELTTITSTADKTTVNLVVTEQVFPNVKFVDKDTDLVFSMEKKSICQFVIGLCNLHADVSLPHWWKPAQKYVSQTINRLRNDRNTAMKWAVLGKLHIKGVDCNPFKMNVN